MYTIEEIKKKATPIAEEYGIKTLKLFGSYAKGLNNENSDIDFIVNKGKMETLFQYISFVNRLEKEFGCHIDVVSTEIEDKNFINSINKESIVLYDK
ncbi:MAG: nucleotidyltransferase domain-containing protein [Lachnospiraceae bacterium]|nr:nucleotidyltransferase domain-containing protein [Lachnospiraceae bacterium]